MPRSLVSCLYAFVPRKGSRATLSIVTKVVNDQLDQRLAAIHVSIPNCKLGRKGHNTIGQAFQASTFLHTATLQTIEAL